MNAWGSGNYGETNVVDDIREGYRDSTRRIIVIDFRYRKIE